MSLRGMKSFHADDSVAKSDCLVLCNDGKLFIVFCVLGNCFMRYPTTVHPTHMARIVPTILLYFLHPWRSDVI